MRDARQFPLWTYFGIIFGIVGIAVGVALSTQASSVQEEIRMLVMTTDKQFQDTKDLTSIVESEQVTIQKIIDVEDNLSVIIIGKKFFTQGGK